ncbi:MAG: YbhB/YbcL family Raf kinase inhibitor-like protein [Alphaproteobacteria bacterium]|nr:YbhB/YbcL family Raf kinase inhibitor-like protein [Alphaproteobacteria bacterium]
MKVTSLGIEKGIIDDKYGKFGKDFILDMPSFSLPFKIEDYPKETVSFAVILDDKDSVPVCGFVWVHWLIANLKKDQIVSGESSNINAEFIQGNNSWNMPLYGGMAPPDKDHIYDLTVFALDKELNLQKGFSLTEMETEMKGHILDSFCLKGKYRSK